MFGEIEMKKQKIYSTIRECEKCSYETFVLNDDLKDRHCKYCGGDLEVKLIGKYQNG